MTAHAAEGALEAALDELCVDVEQAVRDGVNLVVLIDRTAEGEVPIPSLLSLAAVHNHLIARWPAHRRRPDRRDRRRRCARTISPAWWAIPRRASTRMRRTSASATCATPRRDLDRPADEAVANYDRAVVAGIASIMSKMGISTMQGYHSARRSSRSLGLATIPWWRSTSRSTVHAHRRSGRRAACSASSTSATTAPWPWQQRPSPEQLPSARRHRVAAAWRRGAPHQPANHLPAATRLPRGRLRPVPRVQRPRRHVTGRAVTLRDLLDFDTRRATPVPLDEVEPASEHRQALQHRRHELRLHLQGSARVPGHRHEPPGRAQSNTGEGGEDPARETPLANGDRQVQRHQAGGIGPLRRDQPLSRQRHRDPDQDGPGRKARRRRPPARQEGVPVDRRGAPLHAGRGPDLPAAAPRHLLHRGPGGAHLRPEERQPRRARVREAVCARRAWAPSPRAWPRAAPTRSLISGHNGGTGAAPRDSIYHAGMPVGDRPGGDPADASAQRPAQPRGRSRPTASS